MISQQLKTDVLTACLIFKDYNYSFPYKKTVALEQLSDSNETKRSLMLAKYDEINEIGIFIDRISCYLKITIHYIHFSKKYSSTINGPELFIRKVFAVS